LQDVKAFGQAKEAQFYVSMSLARKPMHLFTDSKVVLRETVTRKSARLSPWELIAGSNADRMQKVYFPRKNGHEFVGFL
jgi:hypothetical protein